jgi:hypothetical protein
MATPSIKRKTVVTDPEGNKITTKTRKTNLFGQKGSSKTIIKYADPVSSGKKRDVKYTDAPVPSDEELGIKKKGGVTKMNKMKYKTGGMVNANAKITAAKAATGSVGGISKAISKGAVKSTSPKGKVGGTSKAPKKASPVKLAKAKMGGAKGKC